MREQLKQGDRIALGENTYGIIIATHAYKKDGGCVYLVQLDNRGECLIDGKYINKLPEVIW